MAEGLRRYEKSLWDNPKWDSKNAGIMRTLAGVGFGVVTAPPLFMAGSVAVAESMRREINRENIGWLARGAVEYVSETAVLYSYGAAYGAAKDGLLSATSQPEPAEASLPGETFPTQAEPTPEEESREVWQGFVEGIEEHERAGEETRRRLGFDDADRKAAESIPGDMGITPEQVEEADEVRQDLENRLAPLA